MKKYINIHIVFEILILIFIPLKINGINKIKPVFPFENLLNREIYLQKLFKSQEQKNQVATIKYGYKNSSIIFLKIYHNEDFVEFNSRFKQDYSINKFLIRMDSLYFSLKNYDWKNKTRMKTFCPEISYSYRNNFFELKTKYQYFSNFDFNFFELSIRKKWLEFPITISASKKWKFTPAKSGNKTVSAWLIVEIQFKL